MLGLCQAKNKTETISYFYHKESMSNIKVTKASIPIIGAKAIVTINSVKLILLTCWIIRCML